MDPKDGNQGVGTMAKKTESIRSSSVAGESTTSIDITTPNMIVCEAAKIVARHS
jgi:hypothetical protein